MAQATEWMDFQTPWGIRTNPLSPFSLPHLSFPPSFSSCLLPLFLPLPPEPPHLPTRDRKEALAQTWANVFYFTSQVFILKRISGKKQNPTGKLAHQSFISWTLLLRLRPIGKQVHFCSFKGNRERCSVGRGRHSMGETGTWEET